MTLNCLIKIRNFNVSAVVAAATATAVNIKSQREKDRTKAIERQFAVKLHWSIYILFRVFFKCACKIVIHSKRNISLNLTDNLFIGFFALVSHWLTNERTNEWMAKRENQLNSINETECVLIFVANRRNRILSICFFHFYIYCKSCLVALVHVQRVHCTGACDCTFCLQMELQTWAEQAVTNTHTHTHTHLKCSLITAN